MSKDIKPMGTEEKTEVPPSSPILGGLSAGTILSGVLSIAGSALGAGWPGVVALGAIGLGIPFIVKYLINAFNSKVDNADLDRAGADSGTTSVDLSDQARRVRTGLDELEKRNPPTQK